VKATGWLTGLRVTAGGTGVVSHAGVALIRALADNSGMAGGLSKALASERPLAHDRGRVLADLACAIRRAAVGVPARVDGHLRRRGGQLRSDRPARQDGVPARLPADVLGRMGAGRAGMPGESRI
jgi:hypothetical protein